MIVICVNLHKQIYPARAHQKANSFPRAGATRTLMKNDQKKPKKTKSRA